MLLLYVSQDHSSVPPAVEAALLALGMLGVADREAGAAAGRVLLRLHTLVHPHMGVRDVAMSAVYFLSQLTQDLHRAVPMRVVLLVVSGACASRAAKCGEEWGEVHAVGPCAYVVRKGRGRTAW